MSSIGDGKDISDDAGASGMKNNPTLKPPISANSEVQSGSNSLLVIGDDGISHTVKFLETHELCQSEMTCKSFRMFAAQILDRLVDDMNNKCDHPSEGKGSRTKLIRFIAAKELTDQVKEGLKDHLAENLICPTFQPCRCRGCDSFPLHTTMEIFDGKNKSDIGSAYEFFFTCLEAETCKFLGFIPMKSNGDTLVGCASPSKWIEVDRFLSIAEGNRMRDLYQVVASSKLTVIAVAVHRDSHEARLVGAGLDYSSNDVEIDQGYPEHVLAIAERDVCHDVHMFTNPNDGDVEHTSVSIFVQQENTQSRPKFGFRLSLWGDD